MAMLFISSFAQGQTTVTIGTGTSDHYYYGPLYRSSSGSSFNYSNYVYIYTSSELSIPTGALITKVEWYKNSGTITGGNNVFKIWMDNTTVTSISTTGNLGNHLTGATSVYSNTSQNFTVTGGWESFTLSTPFAYTGNTLKIITGHEKYGSASAANRWRYTYSPGKAEGTAGSSPRTNSSTFSSTYDDNRPNIRITYVMPTPCSGTPNPGSAVASVSSACPNTPFTLSLSNSLSSFSGITYQWQSSANNSTWSNISGATAATYNATQSATTYYRCIVTCTNSSQTVTTSSVMVTANNFLTCYCVPPIGGTGSSFSGCLDNDEIINVTMGTLNNSSGCSGTATTYAYIDYGGSVAAPNLNIGSSYSISVSTPGVWTDRIVGWIDYDHSGTFDASEYFNIGTGSSGSPTATNTWTIPSSAPQGGITKMRIKLQYSSTPSSTSACAGYTYGECEDYNVNLICPAISITSQPSSSLICPGANTSFTAASSGSGLTYQWQVNTGSGWNNIANGGVYSNATTSTLNITAATSGMHGYQYRCVATNSCGSTATSDGNATLTLRSGPTVTTDPSNVSVCWSSSTSFTAAGTGYSTLTYQWQLNTGSGWSNIANGGKYSNATTATLNVSNVDGSMDNYMYRCGITDGCGTTTYTNAATLDIYDAPAVTSHPSNSTICVNANTTFTVAGTAPGITYQWQVNTGSGWSNIANGGVYSNVTAATLNITSATGGMSGYMYRCQVGNLCGATANSNAATLTISNQMDINTHPVSKTACVGVVSSMNISTSGVPTVTYQWQVNTGSGWSNISNGATYAGVTTNTVTFNSPALSMNGYMYRCVATNACGTSATSNSATLTVATAATVTTQPTDMVVCTGTTTTSFVSAATSSAPISYQWQRLAYGSTWVNINNGLHNGGNYSGVTTNTLVVNSATSVISGSKYRCVYNTGCIPATTSNTVSITVNEPPTISATSTNQTICEGQGASFFVNAAGAGLSYQWQVNTGSGWTNLSNGGGYSNVTTNLMTTSATPASFNGNMYRCIVTGTCPPTTATSTPSTLTVYDPVVITSQPKTSDSFCSGGSTTIPLAATGTGASYQWYRISGGNAIAITNGGVYSGATTNTLGISGITESNNYTVYKYYCVISGNCNNVASVVSNIKVLGKPTITSQPPNRTGCDGSSTTISVQAKGGNLTYQWQYRPNGTGSWVSVTNSAVHSGATTNVLLINAATSMHGNQYRCLVTGTCTPSVTSTVSTLSVYANLSPTVTIISTNTDICENSNITFNASASNAGSNPSYQWLKNGAPVGANSSTYSSTNWSTNDEMRCKITSNYICPTSPTAISNKILVKVTKYSTPTISITSSSGNVECSGIPITFKATTTNGGTPPDFEWQVNGTLSGTNADSFVTANLLDGDQVRCRMTSNIKCPSPKTVTSNTIKMTINKTTKSSIVIAANPDTVLCAGDEVTIYSFFTNGGATPAYQWMRNGTDIPGETNATLKTNLLKDGDLIQCRFISSALCVFPEESKGFTFDVGQLLTPTVSVNISYNGGNSYTFTATTQNGGSNPQFQWFKNGVLIQGATGNTYTSTTLEKHDNIYVKLISSHECVTNKTVDSRNITTGIGNINSNTFSDLGLYPNPNTGHFNITGKLKQSITNKDVVVRITNTVGQTVYQQVYPASGNEIDLQVDLKDHIANGTYSASIIIDGDVTNIRFVLNR